MPSLIFKNLVGQQRVQDVLSAAYANGSLAHAYLFSGESGTGKLQAAVELAMGVLCKNPEQVPCYSCESCRKVLHFAHPDLHVVFPVYLHGDMKDSDGISAKGWEQIAKDSRKLVNSPYATLNYKGIPNIPVAWMRDVNHAVLRGAIEGPMSIIIIDSVDMMNKESANTMLKVLEEPPENTIFLCLTDKHHAVLPTIISRCQNLRFGYVGDAQISDALSRLSTRELSGEERDQAVRYAMGSVGRTLFLLENPATEWTVQAAELLRLCMEEDWLALADMIDTLSARENFGACEQVLIHFIYQVRELVLKRGPAPEKYITSTDFQSLDTPRADDLFRNCRQAIAAIRARGNASLVLVNFIIAVMETIHGKKRQAY
ncbi:MAG: hypothetical protein GF350_11435 [Chitinivibrionales bacterium]|nr:hypothetical protein [Chitinivibrionales bacterium]